MHNLLVILPLLLGPAWPNGDNVPRIEISLEKVRWQALPHEVVRVTVGLDGRAWYEVNPGQVNVDNLTYFKRRIAREFTAKAPQYFGAQLALFEPGGRVWFFVPQQLVLLGYDGKEWIEYVFANPNDHLCGTCVTKGGCSGAMSNRYAGGAAWFITTRHVLRYDGAHWQRQCVVDGPQQRDVCLAVSPDGRTAAACQAESSTVWIYQNGKWSSRPLTVGNMQRTPTNLAMGDSKTVWCLVSTGQLYPLVLETDEKPPANTSEKSDEKPDDKIAKTIRDLADDRYQVRKRASEDLLAMGVKIRPRLEKALADATDAEQLVRLRQLLKAWELPPVQMDNALRSVTFGSAKVGEVRWLFHDAAGRVSVVARSIQQGATPAGPGLAILDRANRTRVVLHEDLARTLPPDGIGRPLQAVDGKRLWWPSVPPAGSLRLLDLQRGEFVETVRVSGVAWPQAIDADGRLFLGGRDSYSGHAGVTVYTPGAPETRLALKSTSIPLKNPTFVTTDDGATWAVDFEDGLVRFDGSRWQPLAPQPPGEVHSMVAGKGGVVLVRSVEPGNSVNQETLYRGKQHIDSGDPAPLVKRNQELFGKAFGSDCPFSYNRFRREQRRIFAADQAGNIWYCDDQGRLQVLVGDQWRETAEAMAAVQLRPFRPSLICPVGNGQKMYLADMQSGTACLGKVKDGQIHFTSAPGIYSTGENYPIVRDLEGVIWLNARPGTSDGAGGTINEPVILRLGADGIREKLPRMGTPFHIDLTGAVWFGRVPLESTELLKVWRGGKVVQAITVPHLHPRMLIVSDCPGSLYVLTNMGLQHLSAAAPAFDQYRLGNVYAIDEATGDVVCYACSKNGDLLLSVRRNDPSPPFVLHSIRLPKE